jgi:hypothetical protein
MKYREGDIVIRVGNGLLLTGCIAACIPRPPGTLEDRYLVLFSNGTLIECREEEIRLSQDFVPKGRKTGAVVRTIKDDEARVDDDSIVNIRSCRPICWLNANVWASNN